MQEFNIREAALAEIRKVSTPALEAFRSEIPKTRTSELLAFGIHPEQVFEKVGLNAEYMTDYDAQMIGAAAFLVIGEEIDRRIPVPGTVVEG